MKNPIAQDSVTGLSRRIRPPTSTPTIPNPAAGNKMRTLNLKPRNAPKRKAVMASIGVVTSRLMLLYGVPSLINALTR
jgi:hypothetical protein